MHVAAGLHPDPLGELELSPDLLALAVSRHFSARARKGRNCLMAGNKGRRRENGMVT